MSDSRISRYVHGTHDKGNDNIISRRRNCKSGKTLPRRWRNLRWPVCFTATNARSLSFGRKNCRRCENGSATWLPASRRKVQRDLSQFSTRTTDSSRRRTNRARGRVCCNIRSPREDSRRNFRCDFSRGAGQLSRAFRCCWRRRARRKRRPLVDRSTSGSRPRPTSAMVGVFQ